MQKYSGINQSLGSGFKGESLFLVASSSDDDLDRCKPIGIFKDRESAETHRDACDDYDEINFHHVIELPVNPKIQDNNPLGGGLRRARRFLLVSSCVSPSSAAQVDCLGRLRMLPEERIKKALEIAESGSIDGAHHKAWIIDQIVRALTDCPIEVKTAKDWQGKPYTFEAMGESQEYLNWVEAYQNGEDGPLTYEWDIGIAP